MMTLGTNDAGEHVVHCAVLRADQGTKRTELFGTMAHAATSEALSGLPSLSSTRPTALVPPQPTVQAHT
jgi:hypothetical protein